MCNKNNFFYFFVTLLTWLSTDLPVDEHYGDVYYGLLYILYILAIYSPIYLFFLTKFSQYPNIAHWPLEHRLKMSLKLIKMIIYLPQRSLR